MMLRKNWQALITVLSLILLSSACTYEDGPMISFRSASSRVANHWKYAIVTRNDVEITHYYLSQSIDFKKNGEVNYHYQDSVLSGIWILDDNRKDINVKLILSNGYPVNIYYTITRLKEDEMTLLEIVNNLEMKYYLAPLN